MIRTSSIFNFIVLAPLLMLVVSGCDSNFLGSQQEQIDLQQVPAEVFGQAAIEDLRDVPRVHVDVFEARPWDTDANVLRDSIAAHDGMAMIGLKAPGSERMRANNGIREALTARQFEEALRMLADRNIEINYVYRSFGAASVHMDPDEVYELVDHPMVDYIEIPMVFTLFSSLLNRAPDLFEMSAQQTTPWGITMVQAPEGWSVTTGTGATVLVIDTGMENHEDLPNRPTSNCGGIHDGCSDGPIYHGTHVSGSLMALDNNIGVVGVAPGIASNDVYSWGGCSPTTGFCNEDNIAGGIDAARFMNNEEGVDVINMSFGGPQHTGIANAVAAAWDAGIVLVAAAGNNQGNTIRWPAGYNQVIGVSGVQVDGTFADTSPCILPDGTRASSNWGEHVDISGPFWALSTVETAAYEDENQGWCGTSHATPHVSGAAALLRAENPGWSNQQIVDQLLNTADHPTGSSRDDFYGHGILDVAASLSVPPPTASGEFEVLFGPGSASDGWITVSYEQNDVKTDYFTWDHPIDVAIRITSNVNADSNIQLTAENPSGSIVVLKEKRPGDEHIGKTVNLSNSPDNYIIPDENLITLQ